jgi:hypothetical protein
MLRGGRAERPWLGLCLAETVHGAEIVYTAPFTPSHEQQVEEASYITKLNGQEITASQGALIPALQDRLLAGRPGELVALETSSGKTWIVQTALRPDIPLSKALRSDSRERLALPLFGMALSPALNSGLFARTWHVRRVIRGSIADEMGLSEDDPVSIRSFRVMENEGYAVMLISVKRRRSGFLETVVQLPAAIDLPNTL